ncbi:MULTISPECIES: hypothetical protein [unclassified Haladaptatus]|uniref:hypothetical protein n=1 Tax=unclassified Haladaptatus TaxID=2622732 RepID=UPI00209C2C56|nr:MULTISPECIES: hypothetical protein [unclassified Haladaptatus]MCO8244791.1 hypothetical protein [Haladaptatus sp. AB643]MCO8255697.1 hypothetical protein [Haladaptatus sp. AB618]
MATRTESRIDRPNGERPDTLYAFVAGLYVAILLTPIPVLGVSTVTADGGILYVSYLCSITVFAAIAGWLISHTDGLAVRLGRHDMIWLLGTVPFLPFLGVFAVAAGIGATPPGIAVVLAIVTMAGGIFTGLPLVTMSRNRYSTAALADSTEIIEWEARWPKRWRWFSVGAMGIAIIGGTAGIIAQVVFGVDWGGDLYLLLAVWAPLAGMTNPRTFRITDVGLAVERPLQHRVRPWTAYASYTITDEALVIHPTTWWRSKLRCDRSDIDDINGAIAALDAVLADRAGSVSENS